MKMTEAEIKIIADKLDDDTLRALADYKGFKLVAKYRYNFYNKMEPCPVCGGRSRSEVHKAGTRKRFKRCKTCGFEGLLDMKPSLGWNKAVQQYKEMYSEDIE